jgi:hypothetical protein
MNDVMEQSSTDRPQASMAALAATLLVILGLNLFLRCSLDESGKHLNSFIAVGYKNQLPEIYAQRWWEFLLPCKHMTGAWGTFGLFTVHGLEHVLGGPEGGGPARAYYLGNALLVSTAFVLSWLALRSYLFSTTLALCLAMTTFNHHVYLQSGSIALLFVMTYLLFFLFCQFKLMQPGCRYGVWIPAAGVSLLVYALSYESWLDCVAWMWVVHPILAAVAWRKGDFQRIRVGMAVLAATTVVAGAYVLVKTRIGHGQGHGSESDVVFNYGTSHAILIADDLIAHFFTLFQMAATTYLPPQLFCFSASLREYGPEEIVRLQGGYDAARSGLVAYNHLFLWRFYAGILAAVFFYWWWKSLRSIWKAPSEDGVAFFLFLSMTLAAGATHMIVKFRPSHSTPFVSYHVYFGVVGMSMLISYGVRWIGRNVGSPSWRRGLIALIWLNICYCALARPALLSDMAKHSGYSAYSSDPMKKLKSMLGFQSKG